MRTDNATIVVVGDATKLRRALTTLGALEIFDVEGKPRKGATESKRKPEAP
jgi:hypothetical protein